MCLSNPLKAAILRPVITCDSDVDCWLSKHSPDALLSLKKETRKIDDQKSRELSPSGSFANSGITHDTDFETLGQQLSELGVPEKHWAGRLLNPYFPQAGSKEICDLIRPLLPPVQWAILEGSFSRGLTYEEICPALNITVRRVKHHAACLRQTLTKLVSENAFATLPLDSLSKNIAPDDSSDYQMPLSGTHSPPARRDWYDIWKALQQPTVAVYHAPPARPSVRAMVCFCGRHLNTHDHLRYYKTKTLKCDYCGTSHAQASWKHLSC